MPGATPYPTPIYHITSFSNLDSILQNNGLYSHTQMSRRGLQRSDVSNLEIQGVRHSRQVNCCKYGVLHDYVPFFFCPRPPMLYAVQATHGLATERSMVHLVSTAQAVDAAGLAYFFTDGHATMWLTDYYEALSELIAVDWDVIPLKYWNNTLEDGDRKRRKQAEFLVHRFFPFDLVERIGVYSHSVKLQVQELLQDYDVTVPVSVELDWYYS